MRLYKSSGVKLTLRCVRLVGAFCHRLSITKFVTNSVTKRFVISGQRPCAGGHTFAKVSSISP